MHSSSLEVVRLLQAYPVDELKHIYERHGVEPKLGTRALVEQIQRDGGNTILNYVLRFGQGVSYSEILRDCADKLKVDSTELSTDPEIEEAMLVAIIQQYMEDCPPEDREELQAALGNVGEAQKEVIAHLLRGGLAVGGLALMIRQVGQKAVTQALRFILLRIAGIQAGKQVARIVAVGIPLLNVALAAYTVYELAGPAFRKTLPTVIDIALLRLDQMVDENEVQEKSAS